VTLSPSCTIKRRLIIAALAAIAILTPFFVVQACGPFFEPDVFVRVDTPDNLDAFAKGELGILQPRYDSNEYAVAYRYLNGGKLSPEELRSYAPKKPDPNQDTRDWSKMSPAEIAAAREKDKQAVTDADPAGIWLRKRAELTTQPLPEPEAESFPKDWQGSIVFDPNYLNCPNPAFENATHALQARAATWGKNSPWLADWIHGQDVVFANCTGAALFKPEPAPAGSPALLLADRAYQLAAATFYAKQYDQAIAQFDAIAKDKTSPWAQWGGYLAARATVRKAFALGKATDPYSADLASYDAATMHDAQRRLESLLAAPNPAPSREIVAHELNFVRIRTDSNARLQEISAALAGPASDTNFHQDLDDLSWALIKDLPAKAPTPASGTAAALPQDLPPLLAWISDWRTPSTPSAAYDRWKKDHSTPWFVMALAMADPSDKYAPELLAEAAHIKPSSPAYNTVFFHRIRLLTALNKSGEARSLVDQELATPSAKIIGSYRNALLGERMAVATTFPDFLNFAPRTILSQGSQGAADVQQQAARRPFGFDQDSVDILNRQAPLDLLVQAASDPSLPANLREYIVLAAWTRSVALEDAASAAKLAPQLPAPLLKTAGTSIGFPASLAILRSPGLRPYLEPGVSRLGSFSDLDNYRDNWWTSNWTDPSQPQEDSRTPAKVIAPVAFLTAQQRTTGEAQYKALIAQPAGPILIGQRVIDYAKDHANDPAVPEALALTVRATRYGASDWRDQASEKASQKATTAVSKAAFQLLHTRYPKSPWTAKTPYYY
jgi:hypothetical protein